MSKRLEVKGRLRALGEIKSILSAMKNLSIIEMSKVTRTLEAQQKCDEVATRCLADFEAFYGRPLGGPEDTGEELCVLVGSERGFCGAFNETLLKWLSAAGEDGKTLKVLAVGRKLAMKLEGDTRLTGWLEGPSTAEEIPRVIEGLADRLASDLQGRWVVVFNDGEGTRPDPRAVYPFEERGDTTGSAYPFAALLQLAPETLYPQLMEQHLYFFLSKVFQSSFMAENRERMQHMEGAIQTLEKKLDLLQLKFNSLRQDEITEELEMILLSAEAVP